MGHPWDRLFYRFKGLGDCISKLVNNHGVSYDTINARNPLVNAETPIAELPSIEVIQDPTGGTYTRRVCVPKIGVKTILRKDGNGNVARLLNGRAKLLVSREFIEETKPMEALFCHWDLDVRQFTGFTNYAKIGFEVWSGNFQGNAMFFGASQKTNDFGSWNYVDFVNGNVEQGGTPTYTDVAGLDGASINERLVLVTDNVFSSSATYPVKVDSFIWGPRSILPFSQSWRGNQLAEEVASHLGLTEYLEYIDYDNGQTASAYDALKALVAHTDGANGANILGEAQWQAILEKSPWAGNWYVDGEFAISVASTSISISGGEQYLDVMSVDVGDRAGWDDKMLYAVDSGVSEEQFWQNYAPYSSDNRVIRLEYNSNVPRVESLNIIGFIYGNITATDGGKVYIKIRASDRWIGAESAEREWCSWSDGYPPFCWLDSNVESASVESNSIVYPLTKVETVGVLSKWELQGASPNDILGAENQSVNLEVITSGNCQRIGSKNWASLHAKNWDYNVVNHDAADTCSYKHWN